jgi:hypothetical protein
MPTSTMNAGIAWSTLQKMSKGVRLLSGTRFCVGNWHRLHRQAIGSGRWANFVTLEARHVDVKGCEHGSDLLRFAEGIARPLRYCSHKEYIMDGSDALSAASTNSSSVSSLGTVLAIEEVELVSVVTILGRLMRLPVPLLAQDVRQRLREAKLLSLTDRLGRSGGGN